VSLYQKSAESPEKLTLEKPDDFVDLYEEIAVASPVVPRTPALHLNTELDQVLLSIEKHQKMHSSDIPKINRKVTGNSSGYMQNQEKQIRLFTEFLGKCKFICMFLILFIRIMKQMQ
jgi:hypothetical protein